MNNARHSARLPGAQRRGALRMRSPDGLHWEINYLPLRSGERARERSALGIAGPFQAMFSGLSPLPGPTAIELSELTLQCNIIECTK